MKSTNGKPGSGAPAPASTPYTFTRVERNIYFTALVNNGDRDNFFGALIVNWVEPVTNAITVNNLDPNGGNAALEVVIQGSTEDFDHVVNLDLNGHDLGTVRFRSQARSVSNFSIPASWLTEGENTLTFTAAGGDDDISLVESVKLTYAHRFAADSNALAFAVSGATAVTVTGFTTDQVRVVDLTDPQAPQFLASAVTTASDGTKSVSFATSGVGTRTIFAFGDARVQRAGADRRQRAVDVERRQERRRPRHHHQQGLRRPAATLKAARDAQGISTTVADVQNVYDEFAYGAHGPEAVRAFLQRAKTSWTKAPRYVVLLGDSSFDPRNYMGMGNYDLVPTKLVATAYLKTASDDWFADFTDTGLAQLAIGRIPVRTSEEADAVVGKLVRRDPSVSGTWMKNVDIIRPHQRRAVRLAKPTSSPRSCPVDAEHRPHLLRRDAESVRRRRQRLQQRLAATNYVGHGSVEIWSNDVFSSTAAPRSRTATSCPSS